VSAAKRPRFLLVLDCKNKRYRRQAIWAAGAARARSIPAAGCDERATKPAAQRANEYIVYFCNQALVVFPPKRAIVGFVRRLRAAFFEKLQKGKFSGDG
jgi:hypothetical protein